MPTNKNPNPNATSNLNGWSKGGSSTTLTSTADGARWVGSSSGTGRYLNIKIPFSALEFDNYAVGGLQVRRNSGTARLSSVRLDGGYVYVYEGVDFDYGTAGSYTTINNVYIPTGQFVVIPNTGAQLAGYFDGAGSVKTSAPWPKNDNYFDVIIYAQDSAAFDFTIKGVGLYRSDDMPANPVIDTNDATISATLTGVDNSLTRGFSWNKLPNEPVETLSWDWGDGSSDTTGTALSATYQSPTHTFPAPGVYTVTLTSSNSLGQTASTTKSVTVPWGTFQAGFTYQVSYPDVLVDAHSSAFPSLSPVDTYAWNWGDGTTGSGVTASHTYAAPGTYNVTLTINDTATARTSSITKSVVVTAPSLPITAPQISMGLFLDDPASVVTSSGLQAEMVPLVTADNIRWNWTRNEIPTMSFQAPTNWLGQAVSGLTLDALKSDIVVRLNFGGGWVEPPQGRFIIDTIKQDPLNPQEMVTVNCVGIAADDLAGIYFTPEITGDAYTSAEKAAGYARLYSGSKPGAILWDLLPVATTPGSGAPYLNYMNVDFSSTVDSKSTSWTTTLDSFTVPPDASGLTLLESLIDTGSIDWYCQKNLLRVFNPGNSGLRAPADSPPELLPGRDIAAAPQEQSPVRSSCWGAVVVGGNRVPYTVSDTVSGNESYQRAAYRGRRYVAIQASDISSSAAALAAAKPSLANIYRSKDGEMNRELRFYEDMPWMPYRDYHVGDFVLAPGPDGKLVVVSVESISLTQDANNGMTGSLILGNAFSVNSLQKKVASLSGGAGISVGSVMRSSITPYASRYNSAAQTIATGTWTAMTLDASDELAGGMTWNSTTKEFTLPADGLYMFNAGTHWIANGTGTRFVRVLVDGTVIGTVSKEGASVDAGVYFSRPWRCSAGEKVKFEVNQNSGGNIDTWSSGGRYTFATVTKMGD